LNEDFHGVARLHQYSCLPARYRGPKPLRFLAGSKSPRLSRDLSKDCATLGPHRLISDEQLDPPLAARNGVMTYLSATACLAIQPR
jgi:hypothetical protein